MLGAEPKQPRPQADVRTCGKSPKSSLAPTGHAALETKRECVTRNGAADGRGAAQTYEPDGVRVYVADDRDVVDVELRH